MKARFLLITVRCVAGHSVLDVMDSDGCEEARVGMRKDWETDSQVSAHTSMDMNGSQPISHGFSLLIFSSQILPSVPQLPHLSLFYIHKNMRLKNPLR